MDAERAELYWKWGVRAGVALLLLLANALLVILVVNASDAFTSLDRVGEASKSLKRTAESLDLLALELGEDFERVTSTVERAGEDAKRARETLERAGEDVTRAANTLEDARLDLERAANDFGRIADTLEEAFAR